MAVQNQARLRRINSAQNSLLKELRQAFRRAEPELEGYVAIEGGHILEEAIRSGIRFQAVFFSESGRSQADRLLPQISSHVETVLLPDKVFMSAVPSETPQGVAALVKPKTVKLQDILEIQDENLLVLGLAGVQDPGNVGTMIRSAAAFGVSGVLLGENTARQYNYKVVRASAGLVFREPVVRVRLQEALEALKERGSRIVATSSHKGTPLDQANLTGPITLLIGSEGAGVPREMMKEADELITIPHSPKVDSLNAGIAASLLLYEAARQRRKQVV